MSVQYAGVDWLKIFALKISYGVTGVESRSSIFLCYSATQFLTICQPELANA